MAKVITRFPPSPTGYFHIGNARTALFNYLFTKNQGGEMLLRFEDTDKERSKPEYEKDIIEGMEWLGILHDNKSIPRQSERSEVYKEHLQKLIDSDKAYVSKEEVGRRPEGSSGQSLQTASARRDEVIRFRNPNIKINFDDLVRGEVKFDTTDLGDFVLAKSLDEPVYHLTVVIDDNEMGVTHVIRGEDHISNTPRQILIQEALGFSRPIYAHLPLILGPDRSKLGSRHGAVSVKDYKKDYLSEALVNYLALLGWNPGTDKEIFTIDELITEFSLEKVQKGGAIFNIEKLDWVNKQHLAKLSDEEFSEKAAGNIPGELRNYENFEKILPLIRERVSKFSEIKTLFGKGEFDFYLREPDVDVEKVVWKDESKKETKETLIEIMKLIENLDDFSHDSIKSAVQPFADEKGRGSVLHPMRFSLTDKDKSPDPFTIASIIGRENTIKRLNKAIKTLSE